MSYRNTSWQPTASRNNLVERSRILKKIREFFAERDVLEVETPFVQRYGVTNPYIQSLLCYFNNDPNPFYLQTSPEYHMKRLIAAGSGSIFQLGKAFRCDEVGRIHNPEFTMLEWYRIGFDLEALKDEVDAFMQTIAHTSPAERYSYQDIFLKHCHLDPLNTTVHELQEYVKQQNWNIPELGDNLDDWLMLIFSYAIEPNLQAVTFIDKFPASQAVLSRIDENDPRVCHRLEVYAAGMELANGFYELTDAKEQRARFEAERVQRKHLNLPDMKSDEYFLQALEHGLPECSGIALGVDRLIMLALQTTHIQDVIAFPFQDE